MFTSAVCRALTAAAVGASGVLVLAAPAGAASPNKVTNGGFETPALPKGRRTIDAGSKQLTGWSVAGSVQQDANNRIPADTGNVDLDLYGTARGSVSQSVTVTPGTTYSLSYALGGNFHCGGSPIKTVVVSFGGATVDTESYNDTGASTTSMHYAHHSLQVVAGATSEILQFADDSAKEKTCGAVIDSVSLVASPPTALPEAPAAGLLGLAGVAVVGGAYAFGWRRRRRTA